MALYLDGQKIISGGSGSGGHTIVDSEGTSLEQRTNLQFNGAYSEDNSTDDTTEVNVVREMTKAEFDELTEEEKTGLINITDITSGNDDRFQPVIYSTEEREIGVWIDGNPLYQKTIVITGTSLTAGQSNIISHGISDIDYIQLVNGTYTFGDGEAKLPLPFADNYKPVTDSVVVIEAISSSTIRIGVGLNYQGAVSPNTAWVTVQYTKTTDTAGSGQWTPQGVPAHHYSTDEQVVGTWIDGSTVYEKTYTIADLDYLTSEDYKELFTVPDADTIINISGRLTNSSHTSQYPIPYCSYNSKYAIVVFEDTATHGNAKSFFFRSNDTWADGSLLVVVQYTKSST